jgi:hypothetical protein
VSAVVVARVAVQNARGRIVKTRVTLEDGFHVTFDAPLSKREAVRQAEYQRARGYQSEDAS